MATPKTPNVRLHAITYEAIDKLMNVLDTEIGVTTNRQELVNAIVYGATAAQTSGMLPVFKRAAAAADAAAAEQEAVGE